MNEKQLQDEQCSVSRMMIKYGGSFAAALGRVLIEADDGNALTIKSAWPELWKQFLLFYEKDVEKAKGKIEAEKKATELHRIGVEIAQAPVRRSYRNAKPEESDL